MHGSDPILFRLLAPNTREVCVNLQAPSIKTFLRKRGKSSLSKNFFLMGGGFIFLTRGY